MIFRTAIVFIIILVIIPCKFAAEINYTNQASWTGNCNTGQRKSPINIKIDTLQCSNDVFLYFYQKACFKWQPADKEISTELENNGHTLEYAPKEAGTFWGQVFNNIYENDFDSNKVFLFQNIQFHLHAPSEHTINGYQFPLELHFVHKMAVEHGLNVKNLTVIGVFFEVDDEKDSFFDNLNLDEDAHEAEFDFNLAQAVYNQTQQQGIDLEFFAFEGSLTTPPCTEAVNWHILQQPFTIRQEQLDKIVSHYAGSKQIKLINKDESFAGGRGNNRDTQNLNGRIVRHQQFTACQTQPSLVDAYGAISFVFVVIVVIFLFIKSI